jgi:tetrahydromethanopterin S-methyltransferase subunit B
MHKLKQLHWPLIIGLGALALIWPVMNVTRLMDNLGRPFGPILMTVLISLAWLVIVVLVRVHEPVLTLVFTGITYGVFAILLSAILSPILTGQLMGPITNPVAIVAVLITNAIWGALVGLCALALQAVTRPTHR